MPDLRRQALAGGKTSKTTSKKAQSKAGSRHTSLRGSPASSAAPSRNASRAVSRQGSDDDDDALSDITNFSTMSLDDLVARDGEDDDMGSGWRSELQDDIERIVAKKNSGGVSREESLEEYCHVLTGQYAAEEIEAAKGELVAAFVRMIKNETSERETILALKAFSLTCVTAPDDLVESVRPVLRRLIEDSESTLSKAAGIHALGCLVFFCDAELEADDETLAFLLSIAESDGYSVKADDSAIVVASALEEWGLLMTLVEDASEISRSAMDVLLDQLEAGDSKVQIVAGENIALLFEKSYTAREDDEEDSDTDSSSSSHERAGISGPVLKKRYEVYPRREQVITALTNLTRLSTKSVSKRDRKVIHNTFSEVLVTVENPRLGPRYQTAVNHQTNKAYGSRMIFTVPGLGGFVIDRWWKLSRLRALRRILAGGLVRHWLENEIVGAVMEDQASEKQEKFGTDKVARKGLASTYTRESMRDHSGNFYGDD